MSEWQPIETAPKDGKFILAFWWGEYMEAAVWEGWRGHKAWHPVFRPSAEFRHQPSHWMPLPAPPKNTLLVKNPAPDASAPASPNGIYWESMT